MRPLLILNIESLWGSLHPDPSSHVTIHFGPHHSPSQLCWVDATPLRHRQSFAPVGSYPPVFPYHSTLPAPLGYPPFLSGFNQFTHIAASADWPKFPSLPSHPLSCPTSFISTPPFSPVHHHLESPNRLQLQPSSSPPPGYVFRSFLWVTEFLSSHAATRTPALFLYTILSPESFPPLHLLSTNITLPFYRRPHAPTSYYLVTISVLLTIIYTDINSLPSYSCWQKKKPACHYERSPDTSLT